MALSNNTFRISKLVDKDLIIRIDRSLSGAGVQTQQCVVSFVVGANIALSSLSESSPEFDEVLNSGSEMIANLHVQGILEGRNFIVVINRGRDFVDTVTLQFDSFPENFKFLAINIASIFRKNLGAIDSAEAAAKSVGEALDAQYSARESALQKLEGIANSLVFDQERYRQALELSHRQRIDELDQDHLERQKKVDAKEADLDAQLKAVDDRASRHARRALADKLKVTFEDRARKFTLSSGTVDLRSPIKWFTIILLAIFGGLFLLSSLASLKVFGLSSDSTPEHLVRQIGLAIAFASTSVFYLRWNNSWFERHSREEFVLKRLEIDVDRASWVVELASEWGDRGREIPESLMGRLTTGLFEYEEKVSEPLHPADQLASAIFGASSKATMKVGNGTELEFDRKSHKALAEY